MVRLLRLAALITVTSLIVSDATPLSVAAHQEQTPEDAQPTLTEAQREFVAWGEARFAAAGLELPEVSYEFHPDTEACRWHRGFYLPDAGVVHICTMNDHTLVHELSHAWLEANLTDETKTRFMDLRGVRTWGDRAVPWNERGTEHAAEVIAFGVAEESRLVPWVGEDGHMGYRLVTIPDSDPASLIFAYEMLTGLQPILRDENEWTEPVSTAGFSPEAVRTDQS